MKTVEEIDAEIKAQEIKEHRFGWIVGLVVVIIIAIILIL